MKYTLSTFLLSGFLASLATAQGNLLVVGPGGYPSVPAALAVASPGDILELADGTYPAFSSTIGVTFRAQHDGAAVVRLWAPGRPLPMQLSAPAGQSLHVQGLRFEFPSGAAVAPAELRLSGATSLDGCSLGGFFGMVPQGALVVPAGSHASLQATQCEGPMLVAEGTVRAVQSNFTGASVPGAARPGGLVAGVLHASNCGFMGGDMFLSAPEAPGVQTLAGATVWLADCTVRPGAGFHLVPSIAGPGVSTASRCVGAAGAPLPGPATGLGVTRNGPPQLGRTFIANYRTGPATPVGLHLSFALGDVAVPEILQPWSAPLGASSSLGFAFTDAAGLAGFGWSIPNALVLAGMPIWVHSFGGLSFPLESAPPVGGRLR